MTSHAARAQADVEIRRLTVDDLDLFRDIRAEALWTHPQTFGSAEEDEGGEAMLAAYRHWLSGAILGAFGRGNLIGVAGFYASPTRRSQHRGHIFTVYVRENGRGKGVGDRLIKELLALPRHASSRYILRSCSKQPLQSGPTSATGSRSTARIPVPSA